MNNKDSLDLFSRINQWTEALASCAIEGNKYAIEQLNLKKTDYIAFLNEMLKQEEIINKDCKNVRN